MLSEFFWYGNCNNIFSFLSLRRGVCSLMDVRGGNKPFLVYRVVFDGKDSLAPSYHYSPSIEFISFLFNPSGMSSNILNASLNIHHPGSPLHSIYPSGNYPTKNSSLHILKKNISVIKHSKSFHVFSYKLIVRFSFLNPISMS